MNACPPSCCPLRLDTLDAAVGSLEDTVNFPFPFSLAAPTRGRFPKVKDCQAAGLRRAWREFLIGSNETAALRQLGHQEDVTVAEIFGSTIFIIKYCGGILAINPLVS